jgi:tetratricopeptide (TPR) repeat protein
MAGTYEDARALLQRYAQERDPTEAARLLKQATEVFCEAAASDPARRPAAALVQMAAEELELSAGVDLAKLCKEAAISYYAQNRGDESLPLFERVAAAALANLGGAYEKLVRYDDAADVLRASLRLCPTAQAYSNLGQIHFFRKHYDEAASEYRKATELQPDESLWWGNLGDAERCGGHRKQATEAYREAIKLVKGHLEKNRNDVDAWGRLGLYHAFLGETKQARDAIDEALERKRNDGLVRFRSALVYKEASRPDEAIDEINAAINANYSCEDICKAPSLEALRGRANWPL